MLTNGGAIEILVLTTTSFRRDVAHYTLDGGRLAQIEQEFGQAQITAKEVIGRYRERLMAR